jgi:hypothetical protein
MDRQIVAGNLIMAWFCVRISINKPVNNGHHNINTKLINPDNNKNTGASDTKDFVI